MTTGCRELVRVPGTQLRHALGAVATLAVHLVVLALALHCEPSLASTPLAVTEIDLTPAQPVPLPAEVAPEPPTPHAAAEPVRAEPAKHRREPSAREAPPAAAGALHTAREDAPSDGEPVRFAVDANGAGYGFGVVAQGGVGTERGGSGSAPQLAPRARPLPGTAQPLKAYAVPPRLDESDPCRGFFPVGASADRGEVTVKLLIGERGDVRQLKVLTEQPSDQGFGRAALLCLRPKRFVPARDESERPSPAEVPVTIRFSR